MMQEKTQQANNALATGNSQALSNPFPVAVFPKKIQELMHAAERQGMSKNLLGLAITSAASTAIGNTYNVEEIITVAPIIYGALVGNSSAGKSPAMDLAFRQIYSQERINEDEHALKLQEYMLDFEAWKQLPARQRGIWNKPPEPKLAEIIIDDITPEALIDSLANNHKSLVFKKDELMGLLSSLNSKLEDKLITVWDNGKLKYKTKARNSEIVDKPFLNILGGIQPKLLPDFSKGNRNANGFIFRFLFATFDEPQKEGAIQKLDEQTLFEYYVIIEKLLGLKVEVDELNRRKPEVLYFEPKASSFYQEWRESFTQNFASGDEIEESIVKKLENYSLRFALILQLLYWAASEGEKETIDMRAVEGAIKLTEHFKINAMQVQSMISGPAKQQDHPKKAEIIDLRDKGICYKDIEATLGVSAKTIAKVVLQAKQECEF